MNTLLKTASKKYDALARICNYMNKKKQLILMNGFIASQFSYCPLVWLSHSRTMHNRVILNVIIIDLTKKIKQISLLVKKNKSVSIHQRNLQILATEINKVRNDSGLKLWKIFFTLYRNMTIWEMIEVCKGKETAHWTSWENLYLLLPQKYEK